MFINVYKCIIFYFIAQTPSVAKNRRGVIAKLNLYPHTFFIKQVSAEHTRIVSVFRRYRAIGRSGKRFAVQPITARLGKSAAEYYDVTLIQISVRIALSVEICKGVHLNGGKDLCPYPVPLERILQMLHEQI